MRVLRVYHAGRDAGQRRRESALQAVGAEVALVLPTRWEELAGRQPVGAEPYPVHELPVHRSGDVNRHRYADADVARVLADVQPDLLDLHEEPFSAATRQWLRHAPPDLPVVGYSAQNIDKRWPPPFHAWEQQALTRLTAMYPCSRQAASVLRGKGFRGELEVLPLGLEDRFLDAGEQRHDDGEWTLLLVGRLVPEKGVLDAVHLLAGLRAHRPARLVVVGDGPEAGPAQALAAQLGCAQHVELRPWADVETLAQLYRQAHVTLVPSTATRTWVEQFGRVIVEAQGCGSVVVGYASGSIPEVAAGLVPLAAEGDVDGLTDRVVRLSRDRAEWERLRAAGAERARDLSWRHVAERQVALYERALTARARVPADQADRAHAVEEFGLPAQVAGGGRPFALPVLREDRAWTRAAGRAVDLVAGLRR